MLVLSCGWEWLEQYRIIADHVDRHSIYCSIASKAEGTIEWEQNTLNFTLKRSYSLRFNCNLCFRAQPKKHMTATTCLAHQSVTLSLLSTKVIALQREVYHKWKTAILDDILVVIWLQYWFHWFALTDFLNQGLFLTTQFHLDFGKRTYEQYICKYFVNVLHVMPNWLSIPSVI